MGPGDYKAMSNDMYLFDIPGRFSHGMSSADTDPVIVDILDWVTTKSVDDFNKTLHPLIERYGDDYRVQHYNDAAGDAYMWKNVEMYEYVICWQNTDGTVDIRWTVESAKEDTDANTEDELGTALEVFVGEYIPVGETVEHLKLQSPDHDDYTLIVESDGVVRNVPYMDYEDEKMKIGNGIIISWEDFSSDYCRYIIKMDDDPKTDVELSYHIDDGTMFLKTDKEETQLFYGDYERCKQYMSIRPAIWIEVSE